MTTFSNLTPATLINLASSYHTVKSNQFSAIL